jgi:hypothetical protein
MDHALVSCLVRYVHVVSVVLVLLGFDWELRYLAAVWDCSNAKGETKHRERQHAKADYSFG